MFFFTESCLADIAIEESKRWHFGTIEHFDIFKMVSKMEARNSKNQIFYMYFPNRWPLIDQLPKLN